MNGAVVSGLIGGIGLFLLGVRLMTDGLKLAAGRALRDVIQRSTSTMWRGLATGALITSLVQSSSAVTVGTIGFVNAGLMNLSQAITLIYGSNVGTTMTGWLVALIGFKLNIKIFALPAIGIGMVMRIAGSDRRYGAVGEAVAGFGLFFLGVDELKDAFASLGSGVQLGGVNDQGLLGLLVFVGVGFLLTFLMQSSSAAIAIIITAASGGVVSLTGAAALVIGANVGTTSTAALAVIGATPNAKRVAAAHVAFNLITGLVATLILPFMLFYVVDAMSIAGLAPTPAVSLALFHTVFNVFGVLLLIPFTGRLVRLLNGIFRSAEEDEARPRYLDRTVVSTPALAIQALAMELSRIGTIARRMAKGAISSESGPSPRLAADQAILNSLVDAAAEFSGQMQRSNLPAELDTLLPNGMRVTGYYTIMAELAMEVAKSQGKMPPMEDAEVAEAVAGFKQLAVKFLKGAEPLAIDDAREWQASVTTELTDEYHRAKALLLRAGTRGRITARQMVHLLELISTIRRIVEEAVKGAIYLVGLAPAAGEAGNGAGESGGAG